MNDNDLGKNSQSKSTYRATTNLNTAIENPQINMNSAVGVNIKNVASNNDIDINSTVDNSYSNFNESQSFDYNTQFNQIQNNSIMDFKNNLDDQNSFLNKSVENMESVQYVPTYSEVSSDVTSTSNNGEVVYAPTLEEKKRHDKKFKVPREFKVMLFIVFILLIFILLVPYIYDFFKQLQLVITTG